MTTTGPAPERTARAVLIRPAGPAPMIASGSPGRGARRSNPWREQASGSARAAIEKLGVVGDSIHGSPWKDNSLGHATVEVYTEREFVQAQVFAPLRQYAQVVQKTCGSTQTRSPRTRSSTPSPTAATRPEISWPSVTGGRDGKSPRRYARPCHRSRPMRVRRQPILVWDSGARHAQAVDRPAHGSERQAFR